ncbi:helix-turn-helix domain-containing protein [Streptomyces sp. NPDC055078]
MDSDSLVMRRLFAAAARSGASLIAEAAAAVGGWAVLVDPIAGAVYSSPCAAAPKGVNAAAVAETPSAETGAECTLVRRVAGAALVVRPGVDTSARRADLVARTAVWLLEVRARRAEELRPAEIRLHAAVTRLLLRGETLLAREVIGDLASHATVYRLTGGPDPQGAHEALWRALLPTAARKGTHTLVALLDGELAVVALHAAAADDGRALRLIARAAERHGLLGGVSDPAPLSMLATAWAEAGQARAGAAAGRRLVPVTGLGDRALLRIIPADRLTAWAAALLSPLDPAHRRVLEAWLRSGSIGVTAQLLGISRGTVRSRLRSAAELLPAVLDSATVQAQLLVALRAPAESPVPDRRSVPESPVPDRRTVPESPVPERRTVPETSLTQRRSVPEAPLPEQRTALVTGRPASLPPPIGLVDETTARRWATTLVGPLGEGHRITLRVWLEHLGRSAPAAHALGLHRTTLSRWLEQIEERLGVDLAAPGTRAELHLALETLGGASASRRLPRRGGRAYQ